MKNKKVVFMGTPLFSVPVLEMLIENTNVVLVVTQPDSFVGRKKELKYPPVKECAIKHNIPVFQPTKIRNEYEEILKYNPDIIITCAYGQIIPSILLDTPKYKAVNVHASLLPKLRGGSPLHKCIIDGYSETGVTIMYMAPGMDDGDIITQKKINIEDSDNVGTIHDKLSVMGRDLLLLTLPSIFDGTCNRTKQNESEVTFAYNIKREEEKLDFNKTAREVFNQIRGMYPFPIAYTTLNDEIIKICESKIGDKTTGKIGEIIALYDNGIGVKCSDKEIIITKLKPSGKKEMQAKDFINGRGKDKLLGEKLC
ncbi:MAG: methionyl-tRNA formyltransferase [Tenericutes bacterium]|nr:methionyl-tRNA formyltransferase [Mycoplasmatota bacterium]